MKNNQSGFWTFIFLLLGVLVLPAPLAHSQQTSARGGTGSGSSSLIVLSELASPKNDSVGEELASSITNTIELTMQLTGRLRVERADFLSPTSTFDRSLLYYRQVHANGAVFGSVNRGPHGGYVVNLDVWNAAHPEAKPTVTHRSVTDLLASFGIADELSLQVASTIVGHKLAEGRLVVLNTDTLRRYAVYANGHLLGRNRSSFRILTGHWTIIVARPGPLGDVPVQNFQVTIGRNRTTTVALTGSVEPTTAPKKTPVPRKQARRGTPGLSTQKPLTGSIVLSTASAGVFYLDGVKESHLVAHSTSTLTYLTPGPHSVRMNFDDGSSSVKKVVVVRGQSEAVAFASLGLSQTHGGAVGSGASILLRTQSPGVFYLDGTRESHIVAGSTTALTYLAPGSHTIEIVFDNGSTQSRRVVVSAHQSAPVLVSFSGGKPVGSVIVTTERSGVLSVPGSRPVRLFSGTSATLVNPPTGRFDVTMRFDDGTTKRVRVYYERVDGPRLRLTFDARAASRSTTSGSIGLSTHLSGVFYLDDVRESHVSSGASVTLTYLSAGPHKLKMLFDNGSTQETTVYVPAVGGVSVSVTFAPQAAVATAAAG